MPQGKRGKIGSAIDDFLAEQGILEECEQQAIEQILADQINAAMGKGPSHQGGHGRSYAKWKGRD
jgi:hypothetical protein